MAASDSSSGWLQRWVVAIEVSLLLGLKYERETLALTQWFFRLIKTCALNYISLGGSYKPIKLVKEAKLSKEV